jgi:hypothetical protein
MSGSSDCITAHHYSETAASEYTTEPTALADEAEGADHHISSEHCQQDHQGVEDEPEYAPAEHEEHSEIRAETEEVMLP